MKTIAMKLFISIFALSVLLPGCHNESNKRKEINLNGEWSIARTDTFEIFPAEFKSKVPLPGLIDLAISSLDTSKAFNKGVYWYKTTFVIDRQYPDLIQLKIGKAKYHAKVYVNDQFAGELLYCFTPGYFNISMFLNPPGEVNELMIAVGTYNNMPDTVIRGHDFEKLTYIPGIYDDVKLILSGYPFIRNIQTAPIITEEKIRVVADIDNNGVQGKQRLAYSVKEKKSGKTVARGISKSNDFSISIPGCNLWSPESPFLYELNLSTGSDDKSVSFGMRSFSFDTVPGRALLNGKPYYMRGTNVCIFRFFEDPDRCLLPWTDEWVVKLHNQFKSMHWNSIRYCIGLPPERWYGIADSLGFLIQDEYPVWTLNQHDMIYPEVTANHLANEYRAWMQEHWNHPCVVIWDAQNESVCSVTGEAIKMVRGLDLSDRPWENGWSAPGLPTDPLETHPYLFSRYRNKAVPSAEGPLKDLLGIVRIPGNDANDHDPPENKKRYPNPLIINEYGWLWLNRDGSTTTLTDRVYDVAFGKNLAKEQRIYQYTRHLGMLTEYWRAHRNCAGVLHFCGLGYSRPEEPRGQTSDHFIDIENLAYEPLFVKYMKPAFSPSVLMIDFWDISVNPGSKKEIDVYVINDPDNTWKGILKVTICKDDKVFLTQGREVQITARDRLITTFQVDMPMEIGNYRLEAEIDYQGESVKSIREFKVK